VEQLKEYQKLLHPYILISISIILFLIQNIGSTMEDLTITPRNKIIDQLENCFERHNKIPYFEQLYLLFSGVKDYLIHDESMVLCKEDVEILIYHSKDKDCNLVIILWCNGDIEINSSLGIIEYYSLVNREIELFFKDLAAFLKGKYVLKNTFYEEEIISTTILFEDKLFKTKKINFVDLVKKYLHPKKVFFNEEAGKSFY